MSLYENIIIGRQELSQQQMEALGVNLGFFVEQNGGKIIRSEYCGFRDLAYPIKKSMKGHYYIMQMNAAGSIVAELERIMRINEDIIRHLVVKVDKIEDKDILITQVKTFNDDNSARDQGYRSSPRNNDRSDRDRSDRDRSEKEIENSSFVATDCTAGN